MKEKSEEKKETLLEKYKLQDMVRKVEISEKTRREVEALHRSSDRMIESGEDFVNTYKGKYGQ